METVYKTTYSRHECSHFVCNFCAWTCFATRKVPTFCASASPLVSRLPSSLAATHWRVKRGENCIHFHPRHSPKPYLLPHLDFKDESWRSSSFLSVLFCFFELDFKEDVLDKFISENLRKRFSFAVFCLFWISHIEIIQHSCTSSPCMIPLTKIYNWLLNSMKKSFPWSLSKCCWSPRLFKSKRSVAGSQFVK